LREKDKCPSHLSLHARRRSASWSMRIPRRPAGPRLAESRPVSFRLVILGMLVALLVPPPAVAGPRGPVVRGLDGQADLVLDRGRSLRGYPLRNTGPRARTGKRVGGDLSPIEKARLDARRIAGAPRLTEAQKLERILAVTQHRMPISTDEEARYLRSVRRQVRRSGSTVLSAHAADRTGLCRERAFFLRGLLREAGKPARVRYGVVYDADGGFLGGHAWVESRLGGKTVLLDPSRPREAGRLFRLGPGAAQRVTLDERVDGRLRTVRGVELPSGWLYLPTADLSYR
jgi:hypothetical protein